jgi:hypothetical protein
MDVPKLVVLLARELFSATGHYKSKKLRNAPAQQLRIAVSIGSTRVGAFLA